MKKILPIIFSGILAMGLLSSCGRGSNTDSEKNDETVETSSSQQPSGDENAQRKEINVGIEADVTDWGPWGNTGVGRNTCLYCIYETLLDFNAAEYSLGLLKSFEVSEDGKSMICELWDNIYDSEGNHYTTSDLVWNFEEGGKVHTNLQLVTSIDVVDEYNCVLNMDRALQVGEIRNIMSIPQVTQAAYEASPDGMASNPVGTGPYKLVSQTSGYSFTVEKRDDYWGTGYVEDSRHVANVDVINWYVITESSQRTNALIQHTIDICASINSADISQFDGQNGYHLESYADNSSMVMYENCDESNICSDLNLRLAINYAVSSEAILNSVYNGNGTVNYDLAPSWCTGFNEEWINEDSCVQYDVDKAKEYLGKSSYNGETLRILCTNTEACTSAAQLIQSFLAQIGIDSDVDSYESSVYNEYLKLADKWDICVATRPASTGYVVQTYYSEFGEARYPESGTINFIQDSTLQEKLQTCLNLDTSSQETIDDMHNYIQQNGYCKSLCNYNTDVVVPDYVADIALSLKKTIMPGAFIYTEE